MSNSEMTTTHGQQRMPADSGLNPFAKIASAAISAGTVETESSRAVAEAQGALVIAKRFPRDEARAFAKVMESCSRTGLASVAQYSYPRGGQTVSGPSIRLAEELARCWGNLDYGIRELSRRDGVSEMQAYCTDLETNTKSAQNFTVRHIRDRSSSKGGNQALTDERDIYELTANMGGRRLRARILAILPPDLVEAAVEQCRKTLAGKSDEPIGDRVKRMTAAFAKFGVQPDAIEARLGHPLKDTSADELVDLMGIYQSLKDGMTRVADWFGAEEKGPSDAQNAVTAAASGGQEKQPEPEQKPEKKAGAKQQAKPAAKAEAKEPEPEPAGQPEPQAAASGDDDDVF